MTDTKRPAPARRVARVPAASTTVAGASILFVGALGLLGTQVARGHDPALGAGKASVPAAALSAQPRRVVVRRVVRRVIVTRVVTDAARAPSLPPTTYRASAPVATAPVIQTYAPPVAVPAAPPVQTQTS